MRFILPLLILAALCWWFGFEPVAQALAHVSARGLVLYLLLSALVVLGYAVRWRMVADAVGARAATNCTSGAAGRRCRRCAGAVGEVGR